MSPRVGVELGCATLLLGVAGCGFRGVSDDPPAYDTGAERAFAAESVRVHPLTGVSPSAGGVLLNVYFETRDAFGDFTKETGRLTVLLFEAELDGRRLRPEPDRLWQIDLSDPLENSRYYDPATGLYRVRLTDLPVWLRTDGGSPGLLELKYDTRDGRNRPRTLRAEFVLL